MGSMSHTPPAATDSHHQPDDHGDEHGHQDNAHGEAHDAPALGPIDVTRWGAALLGIGLGLVVLIALLQAVA
jgi:hypothetical protein